MIRVVALGFLITTAGSLSGCNDKDTATAGPPPPVTVARPLQKTITEWDEYTGRFVAVETVEVRARVSGFIDSVHVNEGQIVQKGDLLFVIDQRPFKIAVDQAKGDLERAQAKLEIATLDVNRATPLVTNQTLTEREFETRKSISKRRGGPSRRCRSRPPAGSAQPRMGRSTGPPHRPDFRPARRRRQPHYRRAIWLNAPDNHRFHRSYSLHFRRRRSRLFALPASRCEWRPALVA